MSSCLVHLNWRESCIEMLSQMWWQVEAAGDWHGLWFNQEARSACHSTYNLPSTWKFSYMTLTEAYTLPITLSSTRSSLERKTASTEEGIHEFHRGIWAGCCSGYGGHIVVRMWWSLSGHRLELSQYTMLTQLVISSFSEFEKCCCDFLNGA